MSRMTKLWTKPTISKVKLSAELPNQLDEFRLAMAYEEGFREVFEYIAGLECVKTIYVFQPRRQADGEVMV